MISITFSIGSETHGQTFAFNIVTKTSRFVFIYSIISHCEQQLERKYQAADENYFHMNVIFYTQVPFYESNIFGETQH